MYTTLQYIAYSCAIIPFIITVILFFYFTLHTKEYNKLLSMYFKEGFTLIPLYSYYLSMGFLGSFGMVYYFARLKKGKKIFFSPEKSKDITLFLRRIKPEYTAWIDTYYFYLCMAVLIFISFILLSLIDIFMEYLANAGYYQ